MPTYANLLYGLLEKASDSEIPLLNFKEPLEECYKTYNFREYLYWNSSASYCVLALTQATKREKTKATSRQQIAL